ncbi:unnamed protein product [Meloidogyne enterolobii]|uniref:Uncharacterized protein n=1 Tax=Meloidogyne enterolobii TaxID=390850 RepID=A0ACB0Z289_MELEN
MCVDDLPPPFYFFLSTSWLFTLKYIHTKQQQQFPLPPLFIFLFLLFNHTLFPIFFLLLCQPDTAGAFSTH